MEYTSRPIQEQTRDHGHHHHHLNSYSPLNSPTSNGSATTTTTTKNNNNSGVQTPTTPKPNPRSDCNPYATTFVQADTSNFKHVVQMLTGSSETLKQTPPSSLSSPKQQSQDNSQSKNFTIPPKKQQGFKLYERRSQLKNSLMINTFAQHHHHHRTGSSGFSPRHHQAEILSPSILDFPSLTLSPVTPLSNDLSSNSSEEDRAIAEKGFYLHPSPRTTSSNAQGGGGGGEPEPRLLPLFPVTSPRVSGSSS